MTYLLYGPTIFGVMYLSSGWWPVTRDNLILGPIHAIGLTMGAASKRCHTFYSAMWGFISIAPAGDRGVL